MNERLPRIVAPSLQVDALRRRIAALERLIDDLRADARSLRRRVAALEAPQMPAAPTVAERVLVRDIVDRVALETGISASLIYGRGRRLAVCEARQRVMFEAHSAGLGAMAIGRAIGRDYSTVTHGIAREMERRKA